MAADKMNPDIRNIEIGKITLHKVKVFPLSISDQTGLTDSVVSALSVITEGLSSSKEVSSEDITFLENIKDLINDNINYVIDCVFDPEDKVTSAEITNKQVTKLIEIILEVNYVDLAKNWQNLIQKFQTLMQKKSDLSASLPNSVENSQGTE